VFQRRYTSVSPVVDEGQASDEGVAGKDGDSIDLPSRRRLTLMGAQRGAGIFRTELLRAGLQVDPKEIDVTATGTAGRSLMVTVTLPEPCWEVAWATLETARRRAQLEEGVTVGTTLVPPDDDWSPGAL
jgi:hypothetical protein